MPDMTGIIPSLIEAFGIALLTFLFTRNRYKAEISQLKEDITASKISNEDDRIKSIQTQIETYRMIISDLRKEVTLLKSSIKVLVKKSSRYENALKENNIQIPTDNA